MFLIENEKKDLNELSEKVLRGMKKAIKKLVEKSTANNEKLVIADEAGKIQTIPAKDLVKSVQ